MNGNQALDAREQSIIPIAAFTANGDLAKLKTALQDGLEAGLTVNEIKEILGTMGLSLGMRFDEHGRLIPPDA